MKYVTKNINDGVHTYDVVSNVRISDVEEAMIASGYPMYTSIKSKPFTPDEKEKAWKRTHTLANAPSGSGHDCFLKGIHISFDLTFTVKAWTQAQRYHFFDIVSSMSTMHMLLKMKPCFIEYTNRKIINHFCKLVDKEETAWEDIIYSFPSGLLLKARVTTNFLQLKTIYNQRKTHRLPEWRAFCSWVESLPYSEYITGDRGDT